MIVIPALNCSSQECFSERLLALSHFSPPPSMIHIDISDTSFSSQDSYWDRDSMSLYPAFTYEGHVMQNIASYEDVVSLLDDDLFSRFYFHPRSVGDDRIWDHKKSVPVFDIHDTKKDIQLFFSSHIASHILLLAVSPGASGQDFSSSIFEHVTTLRQVSPHGILSVDGGITPSVAALVRENGVERIISSSFIWGQSDPLSAYRELIAI